MVESSSSDLIKLIFSRNSIRNSTFDCDALGIHYEVSTPLEGWKTTRITTVKRWDASSGGQVLVAEWERNVFKKDRVRLARTGSVDLAPVTDFLAKDSHWNYHRTFVGDDGKSYTWKPKDWSMRCRLAGTEKPVEPVAIFNNRKKPSQHASLDVKPEVRETLDSLIVAFIITEKGRRDRRKAARRNAAAGGAVGG